MNLLQKTAGVLLALGVLTIAAPAMAQSEKPASGQVQQGQALWEKNGCYLCHGSVGQGGFGPAVAVDLVPYVALSIYVRNPTGDMPPFSEKVLSEADLKDIYAYLSAQPEPKSPDSTPLLPKPVVSGGK
ncbi:MAG: cytochrome c, mono- and diheme variant family [Herbaspirillum sp.]|nr:cytochrome c, mono- and diheme variant family [Herbaspirillum sp.]